jgi:hypothetical protein
VLLGEIPGHEVDVRDEIGRIEEGYLGQYLISLGD